MILYYLYNIKKMEYVNMSQSPQSEIKDLNLRPSASSRWLDCTMSPYLYVQYADEIAEYENRTQFDVKNARREHGKHLHTIAEKYLNHLFFKADIDYSQYNQEDLDYITAYGYYIDKEQKSQDSEIYIEEKIFNDQLQIGGTPDCFTYSKSLEKLQIFDLKTGNIQVYAKDNLQLLIYAVLAFEVLEAKGDRIETIELHIFQPNLSFISVQTLEAGELTTFKTYLISRLDEIRDNPTFNPSYDTCKYCYFKLRCSQNQTKSLTVVNNSKKMLKQDIKDLSTTKINNILKHKKEIIQFLEDVEQLALQQALSGIKFKDLKLVQKATRLKWIDEEQALSELSQHLDKESLEVTRLTTPTTVQKLLKVFKSDFDMSHLITRNEDYAIAESSDKRQAVGIEQLHIRDDFNGINSEL